MPKSFFTYSFGCRVNQAEKEEIDRNLIRLGFVQNKANPDLFVINTCSVTHKADREARQLIYKIKRLNPDVKLVVTGCAITNWQKNGLHKDLPIDLAVDNLNKEYLTKLMISRFFQQRENQHGNILKTDISSKLIDSGRLLVKIQDGCHRFCSFCIVPYLRGTPKSQKIADIVSRINSQTKNISEVILTAINTEAFGRDTQESFPELISSVLENTQVARLSFGSIHPWSINDEFLNVYKKFSNSPRLVNFFHIPIQSGSDKILRLMKRGYTKDEMLQKLYSIDRIKQHALVATDIIVGFLDESDTDFKETYEFLLNSPISKFHVFRFSKRQKTAAYYLDNRIKESSDKQKLDRSKALISLSQRKYTKFLQKLVGETMEALVLPKSLNGQNEALLANQAPVLVKRAGKAQGKIVPVKVLSFKSGALFGKIV